MCLSSWLTVQLEVLALELAVQLEVGLSTRFFRWTML